MSHGTILHLRGHVRPPELPAAAGARLVLTFDDALDLAWLRTSLSLAGVGIAITQLFRLGVTFSQPTAVAGSIFRRSSSISTSQTVLAVQPLLASLSSPPTVAELYQIILAQQAQLDAIAPADPNKYTHLGKPIGGSFLVLALLFLYLGTHRFFRVERALMASPSMFPPSRRSVSLATFTVGELSCICSYRRQHTHCVELQGLWCWRHSLWSWQQDSLTGTCETWLVCESFGGICLESW